jgi:hypothetical protein
VALQAEPSVPTHAVWILCWKYIRRTSTNSVGDSKPYFVQYIGQAELIRTKLASNDLRQQMKGRKRGASVAVGAVSPHIAAAILQQGRVPRGGTIPRNPAAYSVVLQLVYYN